MNPILLFDAESAWTDKDSFDSSLSLLSENIQKQVVAFYHRADKRLALGSQLLQRYFFAQSYNVPWNSIKLIRQDGHKPRIDSQVLKNVDYNVSHHSGIVVLASRADGKRVGVDIVHIAMLDGEEFDWMDAFKQVFTASEYKFIESIPEKRTTRFFQLWSLKESFVKGIGLGLVTDLQAIEFRNICDLEKWDHAPRNYQDVAHVYRNGMRLNWYFRFYHLRPFHLVATAYEYPTPARADGEWITPLEIRYQFERTMKTDRPL
ncbi:L-aminoadipate-semialdehyde dehydrogenase-phosphopantetheinyl transferase [Neolecta irregularis DAH-3]|uniref:holo-[acyl-carrier-protein] synthase n=1 Tax=Neolecta irregularis (strain DAH-3) TaxID=1198029 RepID=A0A1U7LSB7_NEOID|nr:L-aminoadipate-semialdehyde dehydrogenase-phosphopantetheinyl transferase [Neolecta irregularis DAH-3]|eukprot:OLL25411.1 L-aminoadipate-semialdehyde dehydrogenase-phosphopantetheinyl transferase [Neolecta irregularis DAH-3]